MSDIVTVQIGILDLFSRYAEAVWRKDHVAFGECFTEDAEWRIGGRILRGRAEIVSLEQIGGFVTKGISLEPMAGHKPQRIVETAAGMLNAIGLQNIGVDEFISRKLPALAKYPSCKVFVNVFGYTVAD